jgi:3-hydroxyisobutyrate dehydrogenase
MALGVGCIGLGNIGRSMARRPSAAGRETSVLDALREPVDERVREVAKPASSPRDLAASYDVIGVCVRGDADVRAVVEGKGRRWRSRR